MTSVGLEMAVPLILLLFAGYKADGWWGTDPWLKLLGALLGMLVAFYNFYKRFIASGGKKP